MKRYPLLIGNYDTDQVLKFQRVTKPTEIVFHPLHPDISMHILHTFL